MAQNLLLFSCIGVLVVVDLERRYQGPWYLHGYDFPNWLDIVVNQKTCTLDVVLLFMPKSYAIDYEVRFEP